MILIVLTSMLCYVLSRASLLTNERCKPCDKAEQEKEIMLSHDEEQLMTSDDITLCLQTSVEYWEKLVGDMEVCVSRICVHPM